MNLITVDQMVFFYSFLKNDIHVCSGTNYRKESVLQIVVLTDNRWRWYSVIWKMGVYRVRHPIRGTDLLKNY